MKRTHVWILAGIAASMLAFIVFVEQRSLSTRELESRRGQVLDRFVRDRVTEVVLRRGGELVVSLERDVAAEETLDTLGVGTWRMRAPVETEADSETLDALFLTLDSAMARRTLRDVSDADVATFGLDAPRLVLELQVADERQVLEVGRDDEAAGGVFVRLQGTRDVALVGRDFVESLDRSADDFRSKRLLAPVVPRLVQRIEMTRGAQRTVLEGSANRWQASEPFVGYVRATSVAAWIDGLLDTRVVVFPPPTTALGEAQLEATLLWREDDEDETVHRGRIRIGGPCPTEAPPGVLTEGDTLVLAQRDDEPAGCVRASSVAALLTDAEALRERRLIASPEDQIERFELTGSPAFSLHLRGGTWSIERGSERSSTETSAVRAFLAAIRAHEADDFAPATPENTSARGLDAPARVLTITRADGAYTERAFLGREDATGIWIRRDGEAVLAHFPTELASLLDADPARVRSRVLARRQADDATRLVLVRGATREVLVFENSTWRIEEPSSLAADRTRVREAVQGLARMEAVRWVPGPIRAEYGLASPSLRVEVTFRPPASPAPDEHEHEHEHEDEDEHESEADEGPLAQLTELRLRVGARAEGGYYASLEGSESAFVVAEAIVGPLLQPLIDRELVAFNTADATELTVRGDASFVLTRESGVLRLDDRAAATDATAAFVERLRSLRAREVIGESPTRFEAAWSIAVTGPGGTRTLELSAEGPELTRVRVSWVPDVQFGIANEVARALREYRP